jgi:hypothetical protein
MENLNKPFPIGNIMTKAWNSSFDAKGAVWAPAIITIVISFIISFIITAIFTGTIGYTGDLNTQHPLNAFIIQLVNAFLIAIILAPFITGMLMVAIKRARGEPVNAASGFQYISHWLKLATINIIITIFALVIDLFFSMVMVLLLRAGTHYMQPDISSHYTNGFVIGVAVIMILCYLTFYAFVVFAMPSAVDKNQSAWEAVCTGARIVMPRWFKMLCIEVMVAVIMIISLLPFSLSTLSHLTWVQVICGIVSLILIIWAVPYVVLVHGEAYKCLNESNQGQDQMS